MNRIQIINALAQYAHPEWYHSLLTWSTPALKLLLEWYEKPEELGPIVTFMWPFGYTVR